MFLTKWHFEINVSGQFSEMPLMFVLKLMFLRKWAFLLDVIAISPNIYLTSYHACILLRIFDRYIRSILVLITIDIIYYRIISVSSIDHRSTKLADSLVVLLSLADLMILIRRLPAGE